MKKFLNRRNGVLLAAALVVVAFFSFKSGDDRNFQIAKNLDTFNTRQYCQSGKKAHAKQNAERFLNVCHMDHLLTYPMSMFSHLYPVHTDGTIFLSAAYFLKRHVQSF